MRKFVMGALASVALALSANVFADTIDNEYYTLEFNEPWQKMAESEADNSLAAVLMNKENGTALTITLVASNDFNAKDMAEATKDNLIKSGQQAGEIEDKGSYYVLPFTVKQSKGIYLFSGGKDGKTVVINALNAVGGDYQDCLDLLKDLEPKQDGLFPEF